MFDWIFRKAMGACASHIEAKTRLTPEEIEAVKESWKRAKHAQIGRKILGTLLEKRPQFAQMYGISEEEVMDGRMTSNTLFQLQACRIQNFLDTTVSSLGLCPTASVFAMAKRIGQIHYYKGVNFGSDSYTVFKKVTADEIIDVAEKTQHLLEKDGGHTEFLDQAIMSPYDTNNCNIRLGWNKLMNEIVREMKEGFVQEARAHNKDEGDS
ncbi:unnamed protein product, partial [Mesorhabditis belari]|uniref:Globin domain-containing protein n=1 Tax=Mesorhabditis belari TaxID=2138241 RepID=A0AAF3FNF9_9BILA